MILFVNRKSIILFLEKKAQKYNFDYEGLSVKGKTRIKKVALIINPSFKALNKAKGYDMIICHHKILAYKNGVFEGKKRLLERDKINFYNYHLIWDTMEGGIADSFMEGIGLMPYERIELDYKGEKIKSLGRIHHYKKEHDEIIQKLKQAGVKTIRTVNKKKEYAKVGFVPGGGFKPEMIIKLAERGVKLIISSDFDWVAKTLASDLRISLLEIDHYSSEKFGGDTLKHMMKQEFSSLNIEFIDEKEDLIQE